MAILHRSVMSRVLTMISLLSYTISVKDDLWNRKIRPIAWKMSVTRFPEIVDGAVWKAIGYHRGCYQNFTKNLDRLKSIVTSNDGAITSRSPRKPTSSQLFPPECIFCEKLELKLSRKTERCITFSIFDEEGATKEPTWKQIECRALELKNYHLHRIVYGEDLFAREARFHPSCRKSFNLQYINHLRETSKATNRTKIETEQDRKATAHLCEEYEGSTSHLEIPRGVQEACGPPWAISHRDELHGNVDW